jgi:hypothetical protein
MRTARLQSNDLGRADHFFGELLFKDSIKDVEKPPAIESTKAPQANGGSLSVRTDAKTRFSDPPAPPPQQPLPEKPDVARTHPFDPSSPSLKRSNTERPRSGPNTSPIRQEPTSQIASLVEALTSAKKEIDSQSARMRDLEEMLQKERQARELAEELAKRLELQSSEGKTNGHVKAEGSVIEEAFEPPSEISEEATTLTNGESIELELAESKEVDTKAISASTSLLEHQMGTMLVEMQQLRADMEAFKQRAETAEAERDAGRKTLAEMVQKIRSEESTGRSSSTERAWSSAKGLGSDLLNNSNAVNSKLGPLLQKVGIANGSIVSPEETGEQRKLAAGTLSRPPGGHDPLLYHATPYASMLGVVLIGMGLMAYLNGWQPPKVDR